MYDYPAGTKYDAYPGKRIQQSLHYWYHFSGQPKGYYGKDRSSDWYYFYKALHNPTSTNEKIASWIKHGGEHQMWAYLTDCKF